MSKYSLLQGTGTPNMTSEVLAIYSTQSSRVRDQNTDRSQQLFNTIS